MLMPKSGRHENENYRKETAKPQPRIETVSACRGKHTDEASANLAGLDSLSCSQISRSSGPPLKKKKKEEKRASEDRDREATLCSFFLFEKGFGFLHDSQPRKTR